MIIEIEATSNESNKENIRNLCRCAETNPINVDTENIEELKSWVKMRAKFQKECKRD